MAVLLESISYITPWSPMYVQLSCSRLYKHKRPERLGLASVRVHACVCACVCVCTCTYMYASEYTRVTDTDYY